MATKWSAVSISGYGDNSPADDGTATEANKVKYSTIKTDLTNPLNSALTSALSGLTEAFNDGTVAKSTTYSTTATDHARTIECTSTFTLSLLAAATAGAGYRVTVKNAGTGLITVARSSTDTINGATSQVLMPKDAATYVVNAAGNGYDVISNFPGAMLMEIEPASTSASLDFALDLTNYARHVIHFDNLKPVTDGVELWGRLSSDGVTYATSAYRWARHNVTDAAAEGLAGSTSDAKFLMANAVGNVDGEQVSGTVEITSVSGMGVRVMWRLNGENASGSYYMINGIGAYVAAASTYFRLMFSTGNISSGTARMYGFRAS